MLAAWFSSGVTNIGNGVQGIGEPAESHHGNTEAAQAAAALRVYGACVQPAARSTAAINEHEQARAQEPEGDRHRPRSRPANSSGTDPLQRPRQPGPKRRAGKRAHTTSPTAATQNRRTYQASSGIPPRKELRDQLRLPSGSGSTTQDEKAKARAITKMRNFARRGRRPALDLTGRNSQRRHQRTARHRCGGIVGRR